MLRPLARRAASCVRIEDLDPQRSRREHEAAALADLAALGIDWDGEPVAPERAPRAPPRGVRAAARTTGGSTAAGARAPRSARRSRRRTAPHAAYPGTCRRLSERERAQRERSGRAVRVAPRRGRARDVGFDDRARRRAARASSTTSSSGARGRPALESAAYNLAVVVDDADQGVGEVVRGDDLLDDARRARSLLARAARAARSRATRTSRSCWAATAGGWPSATARSRSLPQRLARGERVEDVVGWMASSAGLAPAGTALDARELLACFAPARLRREPALLDAGARAQPAAAYSASLTAPSQSIPPSETARCAM